MLSILAFDFMTDCMRYEWPIVRLTPGNASTCNFMPAGFRFSSCIENLPLAMVKTGRGKKERNTYCSCVSKKIPRDNVTIKFLRVFLGKKDNC